MLVKGARIFQDGQLIWDDVAGELNEDLGTLTVIDRGYLKIGNFELLLADGKRITMRSGAPKEAAICANAAYFTLNAIWKNV
jgi:hypothetical protein